MLLLALFTAALFVHVGYLALLRTGFKAATRRTDHRPQQPPKPISVVVAAHNEAKALPRLLEALAAQTHPSFEVIVVNDRSTDDTAGVVAFYAKKHQLIRSLEITDAQGPPKKWALTMGVESARHSLLAFTDADCLPGPRWLETLAACHGDRDDQVLVGYSPFRREAGLLNLFVRYETFLTAFMTAGAVGRGRPYMAVGRNFSYSKCVFERAGGHEESKQSLSGDDDLFVQSIIRKRAGEVSYVSDSSAFVFSEAPDTWRKWLRQKLRHTSAGRFYDSDIKTHLGAFHVTNVLVWISPFFVGWMGLALLVGKSAAHFFVLRKAATVLQESDVLRWYPLMDLMYLLYNALVAPMGVLRKPKRW